MKTTGRLRSMLALNRNVVVLSGTVFLFAGAWFSWYPILPLHLRDLGATNAQVGLAYTLMQLGYQGMQLVGGLLADRFGRKRVIVWPTFAYLPLYLLAAATHNWGLLVTWLVVADSLGAVQWPAFVASIAESVPEAQRGEAFAVFEFAVGLGVAEAQAALKERWALAMEDNVERAVWLAQWSSVLSPDEPVPDYQAAIDAVTAEDLSRVVKTYFTPQRRYLGLHQPVATVASGTRAVGVVMGLGLSAWVARRLWRRAKAGRKREQDRQRDQDHHLVENKEA